MRKEINHRFFHKLNPISAYVLGTFLTSYRVIADSENWFEFRSSHKNLVAIVKRHIETKRGIRRDPRPEKRSYWFTANSSTLIDKLAEYGIEGDKNSRPFPEVPRQLRAHLIRGIVDSQAYIRRHPCGGTLVSFEYEKKMLVSMHAILQHETGIQRDEPRCSRLVYSQGDSMRIYRYIYDDIDFIEANRLFLPVMRSKFCMMSGMNKHVERRMRRQLSRVEKAKKLLMMNESVSEVARHIGYKHFPALYRLFDMYVGVTPAEYRGRKLTGCKNI